MSGHTRLVTDSEGTCPGCGRAVLPTREARHGPWCSADCQALGVGDVDRALERAIVELLARRDPGKTICVSEAAREVYGRRMSGHRERGAGDDGWRRLMDPARRAAGRLKASGDLVVTQAGREVDLWSVTGPIRLRRTH